MEGEVHLFGPLREAVGRKELSYELEDGATVLDVARRVADDHPGTADRLLSPSGGLTSAVSATVNERDVRHLDGDATELDDGDVVRFAPPVVGGAQ